MQKNVLAIGIDGAEYDVFDKMIKKGLMPNLDAIMQEGHALPLDGYVEGPGQGWASFMTGKTPANHWVYYWSLYNNLINTEFIKDKFLWEILGENGIQSCVINMSYTYPPRPFNGFIISGLGSGLSPSDVKSYTYPENLIEEIKQNVGDYLVGFEYEEGTVDDHLNLIRNLVRMTKYRTDACLFIMKTYAPQFVFPVYRGADLIQHCYWNLLEPDYEPDPEFQPIKSMIESYYQELDQSIAKLFNHNKDAIKFIISDHGFIRTKAIVYLNNYLQDQGFLVKQPYTETPGRSLNPLSVARAGLKYIYKRSLKNIKIFKDMNKIRKNITGADRLPIIMNQSKAYADVLYGVNINKETVPKEALPSVKKALIEALTRLTDSQTGDTVMKKVYLKEESYAAHVEGAPDIIFEPDERYHVTFETKPWDDTLFQYMTHEAAAFFTGIHKREGVCIISRGDQPAPANRSPRITDVFATILGIFGIQAPFAIDGKDIFNQS